MKKTALQTIIDELQEQSNELPKNLYSYHCLMAVIDIVKSQLEKEKEDLIESFDYGVSMGILYAQNVETKYGDGCDYVNETFEQ